MQKILPDRGIATTTGIDLIGLETFIVVAQTESFSEAALRLHVSQPTVTGRIQRIESALGTALLRRTTRKVETTKDGARLLVEATQVMDGLGKLVSSFRKKALLARKRVVVAATPTLAALTMPALINDYTQRFPDVEVDLRDLQYAAALAALDEGSADLAVLALDKADAPRYKFQSLWSDDMLLMVPAAHPLANSKKAGPAEFAAYPLIVVEQYQVLRSRIELALENQGKTMPPSKVVANLNTLFGMLSAGMGMTLMPHSMSKHGQVLKHRLLEIEGIDLSRHFGIVQARRRTPSTAETSFCRHLQKTASSFVMALT